MAHRNFFYGMVILTSFCFLFLNPGVSQALFPGGTGIAEPNTTTFTVPPGQTYTLPGGQTLKPGSYTITGTEQQEVSWDRVVNATPGDIVFQKVTLHLHCDFHWTSQAFTMSCTDGTNTLSANYSFAFIESVQAKSKKEQVMVYVWGNYEGDINGIQKAGGVSSGLLSGTEKIDSSGNIASTSLSGTLYGAVDGDSTFQVKVKFTLTPPTTP